RAACELWPRFLRRDVHALNIELFHCLEEILPWQTLTNVRKLLDAWECRERQPLPRSFARQLLTVRKPVTLEGWLSRLPQKTPHRVRARQLVDHLEACLAPPELTVVSPRTKDVPPSLTFKHTATRGFEEEYWNTIARLSAGDYAN